MSRASEIRAALLVLTFSPALAQDRAAAAPPIGTPVTPAELSGFFSIPPSGKGLPAGEGDVGAGREVFEAQCAACHGDHLQGVKETGGPALAGGRGTLAHVPPLKTVESYWPYATTLFDYIKRAMPFNAPGSLSDDQVYALCAYILAHDGIIPDDARIDRTSLPKVVMPNRDGFRPYPGPVPPQ